MSEALPRAWSTYYGRMSAVGRSKRDMWVRHTQDSLTRRMLDSPACHRVMMAGREQLITVAHTEDMAVKRICALPGEHLKHGGIVEFAGGKWLVTELDADNEVYERGLMQRCNHILRWIGKDGTLKVKDCFIEDGTKYLIGEYSEELLTIGDARIALVIGKDEDTCELARGVRFLIDDTDSEVTLAYQITKPNKFFNVYDGEGVFKFILNEVTLTGNDNISLRIADYNNWKPEQHTDGDHVDSDLSVAEIVETAKEEASVPPRDDKEVWI